jgi:small nuclear ribonucleoprotein (snRNP)-like protein
LQTVEAFGIGSEVSIELQSGKKMRGRLDSFDDTQVQLIDKDQSIAFENIKELQVTKVTYRDPDSRASRVETAVQAIGVSQDVKLRLASGKTIKGRIQRSGEGRFDLLSPGKSEFTTISFDEVQELWPGAISRALPPQIPQASTSRRKEALKKLGVTFAVMMLLIASCKGKSGCLP